MIPAQFQQAVLSWFDQHGRKDLPWQLEPTPYRVWVSEIMLQQTQVRTVIPFYLRFMARLPTVEALAAASDDEVLHLWTGLGYYSRARNLHRTAAIIANEHGGRFPDDIGTLAGLPGIGRSTAGAIVAIAHQRPAPILDGNVKRVLARLHAVAGWPGESRVAGMLWELAERYVPGERARDYTQAMMDLGATVCTRARPACHRCPLQPACRAHASGETALYPGRKAARRLPVKRTQMLLIENQHGEVLLCKRPPTGIWGGLWAFPELTGDAAAIDFCRTQLRGDILQQTTWPGFRHSFSHYHLDIDPVYIRVTVEETGVRDADGRQWFSTRAPQPIGLSAPAVKLLRHLDDQRAGRACAEHQPSLPA